MKHVYRTPDGEASIVLERDASAFVAEIGGARRAVEVVRAESVAQSVRLVLRVDGKLVRAVAAKDGERRFVALDGGAAHEFEAATARGGSARRRRAGGPEALTATMHGQVVAVHVEPGDRVETGALLVVLEAMKMELRVTAPHAGVVAAVECRAGEVVERGRTLVRMDEANE